MLYWLLYQKLFPYFRFFRIFRYVTFRCVFASLTAMLIGLLIGPFVIDRLRQFQIGQYIREEGPQSHQKKRHRICRRLHQGRAQTEPWAHLATEAVSTTAGQLDDQRVAAPSTERGHVFHPPGRAFSQEVPS